MADKIRTPYEFFERYKLKKGSKNLSQIGERTRIVRLDTSGLERFIRGSLIPRVQSAVPRIRAVDKNSNSIRHKEEGYIRSGSAFMVNSSQLLTASHVVRALLDELGGKQLYADFPITPGVRSPGKSTLRRLESASYDSAGDRNDYRIGIYSVPLKVVHRSGRKNKDFAVLELNCLESLDIPCVEIADAFTPWYHLILNVGHARGQKHNYVSCGQALFHHKFEKKKKNKYEIALDNNINLEIYGIYSYSSAANKPGDSGGLVCDFSGRALGVIRGPLLKINSCDEPKANNETAMCSILKVDETG